MEPIPETDQDKNTEVGEEAKENEKTDKDELTKAERIKQLQEQNLKEMYPEFYGQDTEEAIAKI